jgi:hypothetical protein
MRMIVACSLFNSLAQIRKTESGASTILLLATPKPAKPEIPTNACQLLRVTDESAPGLD